MRFNTTQQSKYTYDKHGRLEWEHNYAQGKAVIAVEQYV